MALGRLVQAPEGVRRDPGHVDGQDAERARRPQQRVPAGEQGGDRAAVQGSRG